MNIILALVAAVKHTVTIRPRCFSGALNRRGHSRTLLGDWATGFFFSPLVISDPLPLSMRASDCCHCSLMILARPRFGFSTLCPLLWTKQDRVWNKTMADDSSLMTETKGATDRARLNKKTQRGTEPVVGILFIKKSDPRSSTLADGIVKTTCWGIFPLKMNIKCGWESTQVSVKPFSQITLIAADFFFPR